MNALTTAFAVRRSLARLGLLATLGLLAAAPAAVAQPPSSTSFMLAQTSVAGAGATSASASFVVDGTLAQDSVVGEAASTSFRVQSGFWTSASLGFELTVLAAGSGDGAVGGAGIACAATAGTTSGDCTATLPHGSALSVVAAPSAGHAFGGWSGCDATSTTTEPGDTCTVQVLSPRAVTAPFVALGSIGDRVWRDVDGDGVQDPGEPGIDGVTVELAGPSGPASTVTAGDGVYGFADLLPGTHTVSVDPSTLPSGLAPSFDPDGVATPHTAEVFLEDGQTRTDADFGYQAMTDLDATPPRVIGVDTVPTTADGALTDCESVHGQPIELLLVTFDEELAATGDGDVTDPASWLLVGAGPDGELASTGCAGGVAGDDVAVVPQAVSWSPGTATATLELDGALAPGRYRFFACGSGGSVLTDLAGNPLDGDGDGNPGDDFPRPFRADPLNILANGHFDCDLEGWTLESTHPDEIVHSPDDAGGSADSGSAAVENLTASEDFGLGQCVPVEPTTLHTLAFDLRLSAAAHIGVTTECSAYGTAECAGAPLSSSSATLLLGDTGGAWRRLDHDWTPPAASVSALCLVAFSAPAGADFDARVDRARLTVGGEVFADGFESGDTSAWTTIVP